MLFLPWHFVAAYVFDLVLGDPPRWPHPIRWIGWLISGMERIFYNGRASASLKLLAGCVFWLLVIGVVLLATLVLLGVSFGIGPLVGDVVMIWLAYATLSTRSLHRESKRVAAALEQGDLEVARKRLAWLVSRDTKSLDEKDILRALLETVAENISDGVVAPLFYLTLGGPLIAITYKAVNTMDSMVGYLDERYRYFGWMAARADDLANWIPSRMSGLLLIAAAGCLRLDWRGGWRAMRRDARKMRSPNAGFPEAAAAGALQVQLGGTSVYFGQTVKKPLLGHPDRSLTLPVYRSMIRLLYVTSILSFGLALGMRYLICTL